MHWEKEVYCNYMNTPDEDTRLECRNVGSWTLVAFWSYLHEIFTNQSSVKIWACYNYMITPDEDTIDRSVETLGREHE